MNYILSYNLQKDIYCDETYSCILLLCAPPVPVAHIIVFSEVKVAVPLDICTLCIKGNLFYSKISEN